MPLRFAALIANDEAEQLSPLARDMFGRILRSSANMGQMISDMLELLRVVRVAFQPGEEPGLELLRIHLHLGRPGHAGVW